MRTSLQGVDPYRCLLTSFSVLDKNVRKFETVYGYICDVTQMRTCTLRALARRYLVLKIEVCEIGKWDRESLELAGNYVEGQKDESLGGQA